MDAFSAQIVKFVREMPDEALLELVKQKLGVIGAAASRHAGRKLASTARAAAAATQKNSKGKRNSKRDKRRPVASTRRPTISADRQSMLDDVERIVKAGAGVSASDVAKAAGIPQSRAAAALKELKLAKRIFQGGDRRFARYAGDAKTAEQASTIARKTAKGPIVRPPKGGARKGKRAPATPPPQPTAAAA